MLIFKQKFYLYHLTLLFSLLISGCSANHHSVYRYQELDNNNSAVLAVDAKQRFLITTISEIKTCTNGIQKTEKVRRFCAEYSPDVFSVLSQSSSGSGSFGQSADPKSINVALQAAFSSAETGTSISRTQTINMLKEMMYRTCERYLNGQIGDYEYPIIAARDQRIMVSILAIEQLTGTVTPKPIVIASTGTASTGQAIKTIEDAQKSVSVSKEKMDKVQKDFNDLNSDDSLCNTLLGKKVEEITDDANKTKRQKCNTFKENLAKVRDEYNQTKMYFDSLLSLAGKPGESSASTQAAYLSSPVKTTIDKEIETARLKTIEHVSNKVFEIVNKSFDPNDETSFFCYRAIDKQLDTISTACEHFLLNKVNRDSARLLLEYNEAKSEMQPYIEEQFAKFWEIIKSKKAEEADSTKLDMQISQAYDKVNSDEKTKLNKMKMTKEKDEIHQIFNELLSDTCDRLLQ